MSASQRRRGRVRVSRRWRKRSAMPKCGRFASNSVGAERGGASARRGSAGSTATSRISSFSPRNSASDAVRGQLGERLGEIEIVAELRARLLLALAHAGGELGPATTAVRAALPIRSASSANRSARMARAPPVRPPRRAHPFRRRRTARRAGLRVLRRICQQQVGERFEPGLARDLGLRAPLRLVRKIDVLQPRLAVGAADLSFQRVVELALLADRLEDRWRGAPRVRADSAGALRACASCASSSVAGRFLAIAGDERHRGAAVEQADRGGHLRYADAKLGGDALMERGLRLGRCACCLCCHVLLIHALVGSVVGPALPASTTTCLDDDWPRRRLASTTTGLILSHCARSVAGRVWPAVDVNRRRPAE